MININDKEFKSQIEKIDVERFMIESEVDFNEKVVIDGKEYTHEELYELFLENENFIGKIANIEQINKYFKLEVLSNDLKAKNDLVKCVRYLPPIKKSRWAGVYVDFITMMSIDKDSIALVMEMMSLSDSFSVSATKFPIIRISFEVSDVWR